MQSQSVQEEGQTDSFFAKSHLSFKVLLSVIFCLFLNLPLDTVLLLLSGEISKVALIDWFSFCRDICSRHLLNNPQILGGVGDIFEIDESKFGRKRKYGRGTVLRNEGGPWVLGAFERRRKKFVLFTVPNRRETLEPLILQYIAPGTTIHSDLTICSI